MPQRDKTYFISDLHLGSAHHADPEASERRIVRLLEAIRPTAERLFLVGDIFDFWFELRYAIPKGNTRFLGKLAQMADEGIEIHLFTGNHDAWYFDYLQHEIGLTVHTRHLITTLNGKRLYISHGDREDQSSYWVGVMRNLFDNKICQRLFAAIHPRWTFGFAHAISIASRRRGERINRKQKDYSFRGEANERLIKFAKTHAATAERCDYYIFGHRHIDLDMQLAANSRILILGEWFKIHSYATLEPDGSIVLELFEPQ